MGKVGDDTLEPGQIVIDLSSLGTYIRARHPDFDDVVGRGPIDIVHDQTLLLSDTRASIAIGLPRAIALSLVVPWRVVSTTIHYFDTDGAEVQLVHPGIHHRNETLDGLGDPMLLASIGAGLGGWRFTARAGATLPLGRTQPNPYVYGAVLLPHEHIQMGTGTIDPVLAIEASRAWGRWRAGAFALTQQVWYEDSYGYRAGDRYAAGVDVRRSVGRHWSFDGGVETQAETAERWRDTPDITDGNKGRIDLLLGAGASWAATRDLSLELGVKIPVVTRVVGGQLDMPAIVEVGASWSFGGRARTRVRDDRPVDGMITIVDTWATWCTACKVLEPRLVELARAHADRVVLRRVDVSDDDVTTPLPRIAVYDPTGRALLDRSSDGDLSALLDAVRVAVGEPPAPIAVATTVQIRVTDLGFEPGRVAVPAGTPVTLVFDRESATTCATSVVLVVAGRRIEAALPPGTPVAVDVTFPTPGVITYACGMNMLHGTIEVRPPGGGD